MKKIAIIGNLPLWEVSETPVPSSEAWHYCVWLSALVQALSHQQTYEIHWVIPSKQIQKRRIIEARNQIFHLLPKSRLIVGQFTGYLYDTLTIQKELSRIVPDLVHSWGTEDSYSFAASYFRGRKLISIQGLLKAYSERASIARFEQIQSLYEPFTINRFHYITTESPWATARVREIRPSANANPYHLEYAVEERFFDLSRNLSEVPTCLYAGTNTPVKNIPTLIRAFSDPALSHIQLRLAGVSRDEYQNLPANVYPLGRLNRQELAHELSKAWALVHPSLADTGPTIAKEARVVGLPVMLTTACGSQQHIDEGKSGFIVNPNDISAMKESILSMTDSAETALSMGRYGQTDCRRKLSASTMINTLMGIYQEILS